MIKGPIQLSLLPHPVLSARQVGVGEEGESLTIGAVRLRIAFWPLLAGRIEPTELVLRDPMLRLPWPLPARAFSVGGLVGSPRSPRSSRTAV